MKTKREYQSQLISIIKMVENFILCDNRKLPKDICSKIISFFENHPELQTTGTVIGENDSLCVDKTFKECTEIFVPIDSDLFDLILPYLRSSIQTYKKEYPALENKIEPWTVSKTFKIQKYLPNEGYFKEHCEHGDKHSNRVLAWMIYLNDVTDGGQTVFPTQDVKFQPKEGDILIWPAYWTHTHNGITSKTQTKYILTGWFEFI